MTVDPNRATTILTALRFPLLTSWESFPYGTKGLFALVGGLWRDEGAIISCMACPLYKNLFNWLTFVEFK